jgi:hypothetical protein
MYDQHNISQRFNIIISIYVELEIAKFVEALRYHYATSRKVAGSIPDEVIVFFFQFISSFQPHCSPGFDSASERNEYQESSWGGKTRPADKADDLTANFEPIV